MSDFGYNVVPAWSRYVVSYLVSERLRGFGTVTYLIIVDIAGIEHAQYEHRMYRLREKPSLLRSRMECLTFYDCALR